ncbi:MAG: aldehyde dehydrogenase family protein [Myxococcales bacterium]|nr:aldehyde dehydrogenase family protein [Myxococcales bacterium]
MSDWNDDALAMLFPVAADVPAKVRVDASKHGPRWLVDGEVLPWTGQAREVRSRVAVRLGPAVTTMLLGHEAQLTADDAKLAVAAAERAWKHGEGEWPSLHVESRIAAVERFAAAVEAKTDEIATLLMWEIGKAWSSSRDEVTRSVEYIRNTVKELQQLRAGDLSVQHGSAGSKQHYARTHRRPLGLVLCVAPFNYPVNEFLTTVIPALLMGNVVIAKTPRFGVLANLVLLEAFRDCFPKGVVSLMPGDGRVVIPAVMSSTELDVAGNPSGVVDVLAFIGSEGAANAIMRSHPTPITLHKILGLGAKNPCVVLADADLDAAATAIVKGGLGFNGQRCTAEKLVLAHRTVFDALVTKISARVDALEAGMPWQPGVGITPLPEETKLDAMRALIDDAVSKGASVRNTNGGRGAFSIMRPAVVAEVKQGMRLFHEEQFGPIVPVAAFDDVEQVLEWQRHSPFGQQASVWGQAASARALVRKFTRFVARVNVNDVCQRGPDSFGFSAADKSGFGTLSLKEALLSFSRPVLVQAQDQAVLDAFLSRP